ncbi:hypothetical protein R3P38DRAFT_972349 [Favolaschia claudopus]|uniref:Uncharacterized protein n=1 Tax=Favolaschia claudopus TaxID=2862362 RepID=A0AAW0E7D8_9AGAR
MQIFSRRNPSATQNGSPDVHSASTNTHLAPKSSGTTFNVSRNANPGTFETDPFPRQHAKSSKTRDFVTSVLGRKRSTRHATADNRPTSPSFPSNHLPPAPARSNARAAANSAPAYLPPQTPVTAETAPWIREVLSEEARAGLDALAAGGIGRDFDSDDLLDILNAGRPSAVSSTRIPVGDEDDMPGSLETHKASSPRSSFAGRSTVTKSARDCDSDKENQASAIVGRVVRSQKRSSCTPPSVTDKHTPHGTTSVSLITNHRSTVASRPAESNFPKIFMEPNSNDSGSEETNTASGSDWEDSDDESVVFIMPKARLVDDFVSTILNFRRKSQNL